MSEFFTKAMLSPRHIIVTLKNGKVYVGVVVSATFDRNEATKSLSMIVELSGYREAENLKVVLNKNYTPHKNIHDCQVVLLYSEISSLAYYSPEITKRFVDEGVADIGPPNQANAKTVHIHNAPVALVTPANHIDSDAALADETR